MTIQITLRAARVNAGMTQTEAAKKMGIGKDTLLKWEKNPGYVNPIYQEIISKTYALPIDAICFLPKNRI